MISEVGRRKLMSENDSHSDHGSMFATHLTPHPFNELRQRQNVLLLPRPLARTASVPLHTHERRPTTAMYEPSSSLLQGSCSSGVVRIARPRMPAAFICVTASAACGQSAEIGSTRTCSGASKLGTHRQKC